MRFFVVVVCFVVSIQKGRRFSKEPARAMWYAIIDLEKEND